MPQSSLEPTCLYRKCSCFQDQLLLYRAPFSFTFPKLVEIFPVLSGFGGAMHVMLFHKKTFLDSCILNSTNPTRVLDRGYSMAVDQDGRPVTSVSGLKRGDALTVVLKDGKVQTEVK